MFIIPSKKSIQDIISGTGKSLSEALFHGSTNPQYDKRLFIDLPVQCIKTTSSEHVFCFCFDIQNNLPLTLCKVHIF